MKLHSYEDKEGPAKGLINHNLMDEVVIECLVEKIRPMLKTGEDLHRVDALTFKALSQVAIELQGKFYKGLKDVPTTTVVNGRAYRTGEYEKVPVIVSPQSGIRYYNSVKDLVAQRLTESFIENTPTLKHTPDTRGFLHALSRLFPNVCDAKDCANAMRAFIENVHASCHTPGAHDSQSCLWLVSHHVGGTGKSYFMRKCSEVLTEMGVDNAFKILSATRQGFIDMDMGQHTVVFSEDTPKLNENLAEIVNNIIDKSEYGYNEKYGRKGIARSFANLVIGSNYESFEDNTRRYNQVEFIGVNLEKLPPEQQERLPLWNRPNGYKAEIRTLFLTCPFGVEFKYGDGHTTDIVRVRDQGILNDIQNTLKAMDENHFTGSHSMYPTAFVKQMVNLNVIPQSGQKEVTTNLVKFLTQCQNDGKLKEQGRTPIKLRIVDFDQFRTMSNGYQDTNADWIEETEKQWEDLEPVSEEKFKEEDSIPEDLANALGI